MVLAGNKCDMEEERVVSVDSGRLLAEQLGESSRDSSTCGLYIGPSVITVRVISV